MDFNNSLEHGTSSSKSFYKKLKDLGYNAVIDEHDIFGSWMQGEKPIIIMDALSMVGDVKIEDLSQDRLRDSLNEYIRMNRQRR